MQVWLLCAVSLTVNCGLHIFDEQKRLFIFSTHLFFAMKKRFILSSPILALAFVVGCKTGDPFSVDLLDALPPGMRVFGGPGDDAATCVVLSGDSGYVVAGFTLSFHPTTNSNFLLLKTNKDLNQEWSVSIGGDRSDIANYLEKTIDGGYIIVGSTYSFGAGDQDIWLVKTDAKGNQEWATTFGGTGTDIGNCVQQTNDAGYIIVGLTKSLRAGVSDLWLIKTDQLGNQIWSKTYGASGAGYSVRQTRDGGYIIAGETSSLGAGNVDIWLIKSDENGNQQWMRTFGGTLNERAASVRQTKDGGYVICGTTTTFGRGLEDGWIIRVDSSGNQLWAKTYGDTGSDILSDIVETSDGGFAAAGYTNSFGAKGFDGWLLKSDWQGNQLWATTFGGRNDDTIESLKQTSDGGYILCGSSKSFSANSFDAWLVKRDANGH